MCSIIFVLFSVILLSSGQEICIVEDFSDGFNGIFNHECGVVLPFTAQSYNDSDIPPPNNSNGYFLSTPLDSDASCIMTGSTLPIVAGTQIVFNYFATGTAGSCLAMSIPTNNIALLLVDDSKIWQTTSMTITSSTDILLQIQCGLMQGAQLAIDSITFKNIDDCPPEIATTTEQEPSTEDQSTEEPSTDGPSTEEPSTDEPSTDEPSTDEPSTEEPSTEEPSTDGPSTEEPSTDEPSTEEPSTDEPSTEEPSTDEPSTEEPSTEEPSTEEPSTDGPSTEEPSTDEPSTEDPSTEEPSTDGPSTEDPSTEEPSTDEPSTEEPSTDGPSTEEPSTDEPSTDEPSTEEPSTDEPSTEDPSTEEPSTDEPSTEEPSTDGPSTEDPSTEEPSTDEPSTEEPSTTLEPSTEEPTTEDSTKICAIEEFGLDDMGLFNILCTGWTQFIAGSYNDFEFPRPDNSNGFFLSSQQSVVGTCTRTEENIYVDSDSEVVFKYYVFGTSTNCILRLESNGVVLTSEVIVMNNALEWRTVSLVTENPATVAIVAMCGGSSGAKLVIDYVSVESSSGNCSGEQESNRFLRYLLK